MASKIISEIADIIADQEIADDAALRLIRLMKEYKQNYGRSLRWLRKSPAFRLLWDAIEEMAHSSARIPMDFEGPP
jgi:hypothetical protein